MRDPARIDEMVELLHRVWLKHPDWRLGQLVVNVASRAPGSTDFDPFFVEDDVMRDGLKDWVDQP